MSSPARFAMTGLTAFLMLAPTAAYAETPSPTPTMSADAAAPSDSPTSASPTPSTTRPTPSTTRPTPSTASQTPSTTSPTPSSVSPTPSRSAQQKTTATAQALASVTLTLSITAGGTPQPGRFFEDIGYYAIRGTVSRPSSGTKVGIYWYHSGRKQWVNSRVATTSSGGGYGVNQNVGHAAAIAFRATLGGAPGRPGVISSNQVTITVLNSFVRQNKPVSTIDALKNPTISGYIYPARKSISISIDVLRSDKSYRSATTAITDSAGRFKATLSYSNGSLATYSVRTSYAAANRPRRETSTAYQISRVKVLNAVITQTTSAEVAKTYRAGCPVGPSKLRTIKMNYFGFDRRMHRGVMIVRSYLTARTTRSFQEAMQAGFPLAKMKNPNDYGGSDPKQMADNNTSGFNCRKVVGNPYAQSPHAYGIAVDVNPVQNPFRDRNGTWWPANGTPYIDRTPLRFGSACWATTATSPHSYAEKATSGVVCGVPGATTSTSSTTGEPKPAG